VKKISNYGSEIGEKQKEIDKLKSEIAQHTSKHHLLQLEIDNLNNSQNEIDFIKESHSNLKNENEN